MRDTYFFVTVCQPDFFRMQNDGCDECIERFTRKKKSIAPKTPWKPDFSEAKI